MNTALTPATKAPKIMLAEDGHAFTTSRDVATLFGKNHFHVLRDIEKLVAELDAIELEGHESNFGGMFQLTETEVVIGNGAKRADPIYHINRDGFTLLAMGFNGPKALAFKVAYIAAFNAMEARLRAYHMPLEQEDRAFYGKVRARQLPLLFKQSREAMAELKREADQDQRRNLYWQLYRVNCVLGIPVPTMQALGVQRPELAALELDGGAA